jgi:hypothetical protein
MNKTLIWNLILSIFCSTLTCSAFSRDVNQAATVSITKDGTCIEVSNVGTTKEFFPDGNNADFNYNRLNNPATISVGICAVACTPSTYSWQPTGGGSSQCFIGSTQITTANERQKIAIQDLKVGDILLDGNNKEVEVKAVMKYSHNGKKYSINGGEYFVTEAHPFKSTLGWKAMNSELANIVTPDLNITDLIIGDVVYTEDGLEIIFRIDWLESNENIYNIEVSNTHEFIADGYIVHNKPACSGEYICMDSYTGTACTAGQHNSTSGCNNCIDGNSSSYYRSEYICHSDCD